jgi:hypothetical protein
MNDKLRTMNYDYELRNMNYEILTTNYKLPILIQTMNYDEQQLQKTNYETNDNMMIGEDEQRR